jgi:hypothetical protein
MQKTIVYRIERRRHGRKRRARLLDIKKTSFWSKRFPFREKDATDDEVFFLDGKKFY